MSSFKLTAETLTAIQKKSPHIKNLLALELRCSEGTINRYLRENSCQLTMAGALMVLHRETGLPFRKMLESRPLD